MQLVASNLRISRGGRLVIEDLTFAVGGGEALVLTGPNGSGKSTLLRCLAGLIAPDSGTLSLAPDPGETGIGEQCHLIAHKDAVKAALTVIENARFWANYLGGGETSIRSALERFALDGLADVPAAYLSAGQRRRLGLTRLLLAQRPIWLLDEPTVSLDSASANSLDGLIRDHLSGGGLAVIATHIPLALQGGEIRQLRLGTPAITAAEDATP